MGIFLVALMGGVSIFVATLLFGVANDPSSAQKIADSRFTLAAMYGLFALLIGVGVYFVIMGGWMLIFGKRNRALVWIMWALIALVIFTASFVGALVA